MTIVVSNGAYNFLLSAWVWPDPGIYMFWSPRVSGFEAVECSIFGRGMYELPVFGIWIMLMLWNLLVCLMICFVELSKCYCCKFWYFLAGKLSCLVCGICPILLSLVFASLLFVFSLWLLKVLLLRLLCFYSFVSLSVISFICYS